MLTVILTWQKICIYNLSTLISARLCSVQKETFVIILPLVLLDMLPPMG